MMLRGEPLILTGYCIVFNVRSKLLNQYGRTFYEVIHPEACTEDFLDKQDVYLTLYHNNERILAHHVPGGGGNLSLTADPHGVKFLVEYTTEDLFPDLQTALSLVRNGVLTNCSFTYVQSEGDSKAIEYEDIEMEGVQIRHVRKMEKITDICIARSCAAYIDTEVHVKRIQRRIDY